MNEQLLALLHQVEATVDAAPELTRVRPSGFPERARFTFDDSGWSVVVDVRNKSACGRGSRGFYSAQGDGETPEQAVRCFIERLPFFAQVTSRP